MAEIYKTFIAHLEEFRRRVFICVIAILSAMIAAYFYSESIFQFLLKPIQSEVPQLYFFSPSEAFFVRVKVSFLSGVIMASPVILNQIWNFITPALYEKEKQFTTPWIFMTSFLFLLGVFFSFYGVVPTAWRFLIGFQSDFLKPMISMNQYLDFLTTLSLGFGIAFNLPAFLMILVSAKILKVRDLTGYRKHAVVLIFIAAAVLTPGPDVVSQVLLAVPLLFLYEFSILGARVIELRSKIKDQKSK